MDHAARNMLTSLSQGAPAPGIPMSGEQLADVAAEVDRALAEMSPAERDAFLGEILQRASSGEPERDELLKQTGVGLGLSRLAEFVLTGFDGAPEGRPGSGSSLPADSDPAQTADFGLRDTASLNGRTTGGQAGGQRDDGPESEHWRGA